jgi:hypothetical protein
MTKPRRGAGSGTDVMTNRQPPGAMMIKFKKGVYRQAKTGY